ncbi:hypothetical protein [Cupriavidus necator]|uniref:hypothetical protein n=1 Tax=Cupriavidus necator TaxID=106590 RepID=UPI0039C24B10
MPAPRRRAVERVLAGVARHYRQCARAGHAGTPPAALAARIDAASMALSSTAQGSSHDPRAALATIRLALFPPTGADHRAHH